MTRRRARRVAILVAALWGTGCQPSTEAPAPEAPGDKAAPGGDVDSGGWELVWSDEFESPAGTSPDASRWGFDIGGTGWGNAEHQYYTDRVENVATDGEGHLVITAREETVPGSSCWNGPCRYSSARLKTQGRFEPQYGRIEMRAQLPFGQGIWPAFWMLGANLGSVGWPASGEIDIMENIGREPSQVHGTLHGPGYSGGEGVGAGYSLPAGQRFADDFHTFAIEWAPDSIRWFVDGKPYQTLTPANLPAGAPWVFDRPFSLLLNLAVGGQWPGVPDPTTTFPQRMRVDYVRVYERGEASGAALEAEDDATPFFGPREIVVLEALAPLMTNVFGRKTLSLNGDWAYIVDQLRIGDVSPLLRGGVGEDEVARPGELLEYAFDPARTLRVPGDWNSQDPSLFWYRGVVWYRTEFDYRLPEGKRAYLYFGGGNFAKDVYLNGKLIARHRGGFTPFNSDVTEYLEPGRNRLVVKVDSLSEPTDVPTEYNDWLNYGGLTREVLLVEVPRTFVREYSVQLSRERDAIEGWVQLDGPDAGQGATLRIEGLGIEERLETGDDGRANFHVPARPELWAPGSPTRYAVSIESGEDRVGEPIGFRSIETRGEDILLNGEPVFLRGISTHEESILHPGRAYGPEDAAAIIGLVGELNGNYLRLAHYPHNEHMVRAADEAGVLLWVEMPVYHNIRFSNADTLAQAKRQYSEMITRDRNRAAVILWSLANETPGTRARNRFLNELAAHVRAQDDTRLITAALIGFEGMEVVGKYIGTQLAAEKSIIADLLTSDPDPVTIVIDDPLGETVDVIGYNEYLGWYMSRFIAQGMRDQGLEVDEAEVRERMLASMSLFRIATKFGKPLIISEFGAGARQGRRGGPVEIWSEDYQARVYASQLAFLEKSESIRGISPWILKDFRAPYRLNVPVQDYWNRKGLVSETGVKKLAFGVLSDHYAERAAR